MRSTSSSRMNIALVLGTPVLILCLVLFSTIWTGVLAANPHGALAQSASSAGSSDWPTFLSDHGHDGYNSAETVINPTSAPGLHPHWIVSAGSTISTQPVVANGTIYWGSWDGYEHATNLNGGQLWATNLGQTVDTNPACSPTSAGVASTATVASVSVKGTVTPVVFVGGGNAHFYALNATTGAIIWQRVLGTSPSHFIWSSPTVYNGSVYVGVASFGDCPQVQGQLIQMSVSTGAVLHTFNVVPAGCTGGTIWSSPTLDLSNGTLYIATSDVLHCSKATPYATALVALRASTLTPLSSWKVPRGDRGPDSDFGATPTIFQATFGGIVRRMVGVANKNGVYYAFDRTNISKGPVWTAAIATGGDCPGCGNGSISSSAWDGTNLYVAGGNTTISGIPCQGSVRAFNPANGTIIWEHCMTDGPVLGAVSAVPGIVAVGEGNTLVLLATTLGQTLFTYPGHTGGSLFYGPASISGGVLYIGNADGNLYAFGT
jgi:outer membrane protein assembly factor BamB